MPCMEQAEYSEWYRKDTLLRALRIYDKMVEDDRQGVRPLYRPLSTEEIRKRRKETIGQTERGTLPQFLFPPPLKVNLPTS
jgi:hypothetical protein